MEREKDKEICLLEDNPFLQEHSTFLKFIFGKKNTLKNAKNQTFFAKNIFGETVIAFLAEFLADFRRSFYAIKKFQRQQMC